MVLYPSFAFSSGGTCPSSVPTDITNCYYIDYVGGADSNNGTSKDTPWKHAPGMTGVVNNVGPGTIDDKAGSKCGSNPCNYSHTGFIFKGGVTWTHQAFPMTMRLTGTAIDARVYWGVDPTWYTGSSWTRPILDFGGTDGTIGTPLVQFAPVRYIIWDNFEFINLYWDHTCIGLSNGKVAYLNSGGSAPGGPYIEIKNNYFHKWSHEAYEPYHVPDTADMVAGTTQGMNVGSSVHDNVFDGSDVDNTNGYSGCAVRGSPNIIYNNYFKGLANGFVGLANDQQGQVYQNTFDGLGTSFDLTAHTQCYEDNSNHGILFFNNLIKNCTSIGMVVNISTAYGYTSYVWNNVIYNVVNNSNILVFSYPANQSTGGTNYAFNNTIEAGPDSGTPSSLILGHLPNLTASIYKNNHIISTANQAANCTGNCSQSNNLFQTKAEANAQGYNSNPLAYPFFPPAGGATINAGYNLTSFCASIPASPATPSSACLNDTNIGVSYNTVNHTVSYPNKPAVIRRTWDIGAYEYQFAPSQKVGVGSLIKNGEGSTIKWFE